jgi:uncharacterized protein YqcC (DUF446 family)
MAGPVVDTPSALEFEREIMSRASEAELQGIAVDLGRKSEALQDLLSAGPSRLDGPALRQVLRWVFATRRKAEQILGLVGAKPLAAAIAGLLDEAAASTPPRPGGRPGVAPVRSPGRAVAFHCARQVLVVDEMAMGPRRPDRRPGPGHDR